MFKRFLWELDKPTYEGSDRDRVEVHPYLETVHLLRGDERTKAEEVLIANLSTNNCRAAKALVEVRCVRAIPALIQATSAQATPSMRLAAAEALLQLHDTSGRQALIKILRTRDGDHEVRSDAVDLLVRFPHPDTDFLLEVACTDPDCGVRWSTFHAVLAAHGLAGKDTSRGEVLFSIAGRLLSSLQTIRHEAHTEMRTILAKWKAGATKEDLNLTWQTTERDEAFERLVDSFEDDKPHWPIDGLRDRTGLERTLLETLSSFDRQGSSRRAGRQHPRRATGDGTTARTAAHQHRTHPRGNRIHRRNTQQTAWAQFCRPPWGCRAELRSGGGVERVPAVPAMSRKTTTWP